MNVQPTILIIDDEPMARVALEALLSGEPYDLFFADNGVRGLTMANDLSPDAILLDVMMPDVSGLEVLRYMRREPSLMHIPVVIVSARTLPTDIRAGMEAGASAYLTKPVGFQELRETVEEVIRAAEKLKTAPKPESASDGQSNL